MPNQHNYGFRFFRSLSGSDTPQIFTLPIASGYAPNTGVDGAGGTAVNLNVGDPVQLIDGGTLRLVQPGQATTTAVLDDATFGVVVGFARVFVNGGIRPNSYYPSGTTYTGGIGGQNATLVSVIPVKDNIFEIDAGAAPGTSFDDQSEWAGAVGKGAHFTYSVLTSGIGQPKANPLISTTFDSTTGVRQLRVVGLSKLGDTQDYTAANVRLQVMFNAVQLSGYTPQTADIET
jgi:hypothetical protein